MIRKTRGMTILEVAVAIAIFAIATASIYSFFRTIKQGSLSMERAAEIEEELNLLLNVQVRRAFDSRLLPGPSDAAPYDVSHVTSLSSGFVASSKCRDLSLNERNTVTGKYETVTFQTKCTSETLMSEKLVHPDTACTTKQSQVVVTRTCAGIGCATTGTMTGTGTMSGTGTSSSTGTTSATGTMTGTGTMSGTGTTSGTATTTATGTETATTITGFIVSKQTYPVNGLSLALCFVKTGEEIVVQAGSIYGKPPRQVNGALVLTSANTSTGLEQLNYGFPLPPASTGTSTYMGMFGTGTGTSVTTMTSTSTTTSTSTMTSTTTTTGTGTTTTTSTATTTSTGTATCGTPGSSCTLSSQCCSNMCMTGHCM